MQRRLFVYIVREQISPFFLGLSVIVFVFLMNFIIKSIDRILGKGLPLSVIFEYIGLNLAWIIALAVPMSVLIAALMSYGRLSADNEITALKAAGVSFYRMLLPGIISAVLLTAFMIYFNDVVLPEFNHRARMLGSDIYRKRPDLNIEEGYFVTDLPQYSLLVKKKNKEILEDITIYSKENTRIQTTVIAKRGTISIRGEKIVLDLEDGEIHEFNVQKPDDYKKIDFQRHAVTIPVSNMILERSNTRRRGDREMSAAMMHEQVAKFQGKIDASKQKIHKIASDQYATLFLEELFVNADLSESDSVSHDEFTLDDEEEERALGKAYRKAKRILQLMKSETNIILNYSKQQSRYRVEIEKKYSIPTACIVFMLVGAPLGIMARHGGLAVGGSLSLGFFLLYWAFLIAGEQLADRMYIPPFWAMWTPNILIGLFGIYLSVRSVRELAHWDIEHIMEKFRRKKKVDE